MASSYYKKCEELNRCIELGKFWDSKDFVSWFEGHLVIAKETSYALAECQVGYAYLEGIGTEKNFEKALYWTTKSAEHGDRDEQFNLAWIYENGIGVEKDLEKSIYWYKQAAFQNHDLAINKCQELNVPLTII